MFLRRHTRLYLVASRSPPFLVYTSFYFDVRHCLAPPLLSRIKRRRHPPRLSPIQPIHYPLAFAAPTFPVHILIMPASSSDRSDDSGRSFFEHPRPAPLPPSSSSSRSARSTPEGFVLPVIPPSDDPLVVTQDARGRPQLPRVSDSPLHVDDGRVLKLAKYHPMIVPKCASCAKMGVNCSFSEAGIPCPPCTVLGIPDCDWSDPFWLMENLQRCRDIYLLDEQDTLVKSVQDNRLAPSLFEREFERVQAWFYSGAQGAISRFLINSHATHGLALRGYRSLAAASTDPSLLLRFLSLGTEAHIHPSVLEVVTERVQSFFHSMLS
ncbi:hypothetical protein B0H14DRAFT_2901302 [Mycena olivaceomarginata]|nr:hypothetical protein B0H14DRAFT_2901302 [Mycena olivaceomarginata]